MKLKCNCGYEWDYEGKMKYYATCPDCHKANPIRDLTKSVRDNIGEM